MKKSLLSLFSLLALLTLADPVPARPVVFVSIPPQAWLLKALAQDRLEIRTLLPDGANPHTFEPTARQLKSLADATLYLTQGMPFEETLIPKIATFHPGLTIAAMDRGIAKRPSAEHAHSDAHAHPDPHIWLAPALFAAMASNTVQTLNQTFPQQRETWEAALPKTVKTIQTADRELREKRATAQNTTWVIYHPAWDYLIHAYDLKALVIEHEGKAPSARRIAEILKAAQAAKAKSVLIGPQNDPRSARWIADQLGGRLVTLNPLQEDWPDLMRQVRDVME